MQKAQSKLQLSPLDIPLAVFLLSAILGTLPAFNRDLVWTPLVTLILCGLLYLLVSRVAASERWSFLIGRFVVIVCGLVAFYFITQYSHYPGLNKVESISRLAGWIGKLFPSMVFWAPVANSLGTLLEGIFFLAVGLFLLEKRVGWRVVLGLTASILLLALVVSESRGAWLAVGVAGLVWLAIYFRWAKWLAILLALGMLVLIIWVVIQRDIQVMDRIPLVNRVLAPLFIRPDRLEVYRGSIHLIQDMPFTGIGLGNQFAIAYSRYVLRIQVPFLYYSHNLFLEAWLEQGLLGIFALIWMLAALFWSAAKAQLTGHNLFLESTWIGLTAIFLHGFTDARQYMDLWCWLPAFILLGLFAALHRRQVILPSRTLFWGPLGVAGVFLGIVLVMLPSLPGSWQANLGCIKQAWLDLGPSLDEPQKSQLRQEAIENFSRSIGFRNDQRTAHLRLGMIFLDEEQFREAVQHLEAAHQVDPTNPATIKTLGFAYVWAGELEKARDLLQSVPEIVEELNYWGWWRGTRQQVGLSKYAYQVSLLLEPDQPGVRQVIDALQNPR